MTELEENLLEEIEFWERFIREWKTDSKGPLPIKARESLSYAEHKMDLILTAENESSSTRGQSTIMRNTTSQTH